MGLLVGAGKGVVHTIYNHPDNYIDYVPCDVVVKGIVMCSCEIARKGLGPPLVYNAAQAGMHHITQKRIMDFGIVGCALLPFSDILYYPCGVITSNYLFFLMLFFFFHLVPAVIVDALLSATGRKPMLVRLQRRIYSAMIALSWFLLRNWDFSNKRFLGLEKRLRPEDREGFSYQLENIVPELFFRDALRGTRRYLMKEPDSNLPQAIRAYKRSTHRQASATESFKANMEAREGELETFNSSDPEETVLCHDYLDYFIHALLSVVCGMVQVIRKRKSTSSQSHNLNWNALILFL
ncbi:uncharacterized protein GBIM_14198 [Gryllus bimaculatus]|nr:uncharacterized protein GBIM_14198 [Gryllus bimaculatus]